MLSPTGRLDRPAHSREAGLRPGRFAAAAAGSALLAGTTFALAGAAAGPAALASSAGHVPAASVVITPDAIHAAHTALAVPPSTAFCEQHFKIACYLPRQIEQAYGLPQLYRRGITGAGQTIVIVDSFGSPTVAARPGRVRPGRRAARRRRRCGSSSPPGKVPPYKPTDDRVGWAGETDLDVEYAHAIAPGASILLVETPTSEDEGTTGFPQIVAAEKYVISHHLGGVISQSFSATEQTFPTRASLLNLRGAYTAAGARGRHRAGRLRRQRGGGREVRRLDVLPAPGDVLAGQRPAGHRRRRHAAAPGAAWPDRPGHGLERHLQRADPELHLRRRPARTPLAGGGGKSVIFGRPGYQDGVAAVVGSQRGVPDISMSGACNGAADMYQSFGGQPAGWYPTCGTSEATPEFAGIVALADQVAGHPLGLINPALYALSGQHAPGLADVTQRQQHGLLPAGRARSTRSPASPPGPATTWPPGVGTV